MVVWGPRVPGSRHAFVLTVGCGGWSWCGWWVGGGGGVGRPRVPGSRHGRSPNAPRICNPLAVGSWPCHPGDDSALIFPFIRAPPVQSPPPSSHVTTYHHHYHHRTHYPPTHHPPPPVHHHPSTPVAMWLTRLPSLRSLSSPTPRMMPPCILTHPSLIMTHPFVLPGGHYTRALEQDPFGHVFYSNRSACAAEEEE